MHDIIDIIKNLQTLTENNNSFRVLKDFERVIDHLDIYVFENWEEGELMSGPYINRHDVVCKFMWPLKTMPNPQGGRRLEEYGCRVSYTKTNLLVPRKIKDPDDFRPGTKKGKIDPHPIWLVEIKMPKKLMQDVYVGSENRSDNAISELMKYHQPITPESVGQEETGNEQETS